MMKGRNRGHRVRGIYLTHCRLSFGSDVAYCGAWAVGLMFNSV